MYTHCSLCRKYMFLFFSIHVLFHGHWARTVADEATLSIDFDRWNDYLPSSILKQWSDMHYGFLSDHPTNFFYCIKWPIITMLEDCFVGTLPTTANNVITQEKFQQPCTGPGRVRDGKQSNEMETRYLRSGQDWASLSAYRTLQTLQQSQSFLLLP
jgi:hypothetical protein